MRYEVQISARHLCWPNTCACCDELSETTFDASASKVKGKNIKTTITNTWAVPYCNLCIKHLQKDKLADELAVAGIIGLIFIWILIGIITGSGIIGFLVGLILAGCLFYLMKYKNNQAAQSMKRSCCTAGPAVQYVGWYGSMHTFRFSRRDYMDKFLSKNSQKTQSNVKVV
jgi:hypothetical protein